MSRIVIVLDAGNFLKKEFSLQSCPPWHRRSGQIDARVQTEEDGQFVFIFYVIWLSFHNALLRFTMKSKRIVISTMRYHHRMQLLIIFDVCETVCILSGPCARTRSHDRIQRGDSPPSKLPSEYLGCGRTTEVETMLETLLHAHTRSVGERDVDGCWIWSINYVTSFLLDM